MHYSLLDAGGAALLVIVVGAGILFLVLAIVIEAFFIKGMGLVDHFGKAMLQSFLANLITVIAGYLLMFAAGEYFFDYIWITLALCYIITVLIEAKILQAMNHGSTFRGTLRVSTYMNIVTYVVLYILVFINR